MGWEIRCQTKRLLLFWNGYWPGRRQASFASSGFLSESAMPSFFCSRFWNNLNSLTCIDQKRTKGGQRVPKGSPIVTEMHPHASKMEFDLCQSDPRNIQKHPLRNRSEKGVPQVCLRLCGFGRLLGPLWRELDKNASNEYSFVSSKCIFQALCRFSQHGPTADSYREYTTWDQL